MTMVEVMDVLKFRRWEQSKKVNFGRLFAYISEMREIQAELQCGKVFPSSYLATYSRHKDRNYILVVDMIKQVDSVYGNKPIVYAQLIVGRNQIIVSMIDLNLSDKKKEEIIYDSNTKILIIARGLLELFKSSGIHPVKTADYYFGNVMSKYQTSFDDTFEMLSDGEIESLMEKLKLNGFKLDSTGCAKYMSEFTVTVNHKNIYNDYIVSLIDNNDQSNIHWAIKDENLDAYLEAIQEAHAKWKSTRKG
jgi:hypothetical protein